MFLPHIGLSELEDECLSKILPKVVTMFDSMVKEILDQVGGLSSQNTELCSLLRNILQVLLLLYALSTCVRHVGTFEEVPDLVTIRSLPACILKILRETFQHCKDSEVVYCGRLSLVADLLQGLFKEAYTLQKGLLELLDRISLDMIHSLLDICSIISNLDIALHANTWKFLIKQSLKYQSLVEEHLHHSDICNSMCDNLLASFHNCVELSEQIKHGGLTEYKLFQKSAKMCRFFANTLVHYIKEFKFFLAKYCRCFHQLYLKIISKFSPSLCAPTLPSALSEELNAAALVPMEALLLQLLPFRPFADVVLQPDLPEHELPQCLLLVNALGQLSSQTEEVLQLWYSGSQFSEETPRLPLYQALFTSFRRCSTERQVPVLLPGLMMKGQAQIKVTLHRHICVQLCASVAALPPVYFPVLERCLADAVLQADTQTALLATDMWCFTARYGTAELCLHHVCLIAQLVKACTTECYQSFHLGLLLRRMVFLMTPNHQMELVARFPPSEVENLPVWRHVLLRALSQDARYRVETDIIGLTQKALTDWQNGGCKLGQVHKVVRRSSDIVVGCAEPQLLLAALEFLSSLGKIFVPPDSQNQILPRLSSLFGVLLSDRSWLLHQHALEAFSHFAEITNHEEVISQSLCDEGTKTKVVNYLSKVRRANILYISPAIIPPSQPCPKRARQETSAEEEYSRYIQTAESALKALQALSAPPPQWLGSRLKELQSIITNISTTRHTT
uniref:Fignl1 interacting regulator of recombination and mitosis n=1 Tax=Sparus aurata TaxID=8175 RepID=A0A671VFQ1_SPAAU